MPESEEINLEPLIAGLRGARGASRLYLAQAIQALLYDGAAGTLRIHVPRKGTQHVEVEWLGLNNHPDRLQP